MDSQSLLQGIFPTRSNLHVLYCKQILYDLQTREAHMLLQAQVFMLLQQPLELSFSSAPITRVQYSFTLADEGKLMPTPDQGPSQPTIGIQPRGGIDFFFFQPLKKFELFVTMEFLNHCTIIKCGAQSNEGRYSLSHSLDLFLDEGRSSLHHIHVEAFLFIENSC